MLCAPQKIRILAEKRTEDSKCPEQNKYHRQNVGTIYAELIGYPKSFSRVCFKHKVIPTPALALPSTEAYVKERAERKYITADDKVLKVKNTASLAKRLNKGKEIEAESARK